MHRRTLLAGAAALAAGPARAEAQTVRMSHGYGIHYLPLMVIRDRQLLEKQAEQMGLGKLDLNWRVLDGGNVINDAMLSGAIDIAGTGAPGFITLWAKARNTPGSAVTGVSALGNGALWLNSNNPALRSLRDFSAKDKIAVPGIKTSFAAVVLQMAAAQEFGEENYAKLDPFTVGMPHPEAMAALVSGKTEIDAHFASPPFSNEELTYPNIHRVISTLDLLGPITIDVVFASKRFADANPGLMKAFLAAKDEADQFIARDKAGAAESYARVSKVNLKPELIRAMLDDKETSFTVAPSGVMKYAEFLGRIGTIKNPPKVWTELFIPELAGYPGS
jgi:NitT/TauT family transport system substrate-binding protein